MTDTKLGELRAAATSQQRAMLDKAWIHIAEKGKPISERAFFHAFPREQSVPALDQLGGKIIIQSYAEGVSSFAPTLLGALLTSSGEDLEALLQRCLQYVRDRYEESPESSYCSSEQLALGCAFKPEELDHLRALLSLSYHQLVVTSGGGQKGGPWTLLVSDEVDQLRTVKDWTAYLHGEVTKGFDPSFPVYEGKRAALTLPQWSILDGLQTSPHQGQSTTMREYELSFKFIPDEALRNVLAADWNEAVQVLDMGAWKSCVMLCGSVVEGMLLALARRIPGQELQTTVRVLKLREMALDERGLADLLKLCEHKELLDPERSHLTQFIRLHRNLIHPGLQSHKNVTVQKEEAVIAINAVRSIARLIGDREPRS